MVGCASCSARFTNDWADAVGGWGRSAWRPCGSWAPPRQVAAPTGRCRKHSGTSRKKDMLQHRRTSGQNARREPVRLVLRAVRLV